jgi:hypothetical protein
MVTTLTAEREQASVVTAAHAWGGPYPAARAQWRVSSPFPSSSRTTSALLCFWATATRHRLAGVLATRSLIHSALSFIKGSRCFGTRIFSSSSTLSTPTPDPVADFRRPLVSSLLRTSHHRPSGAKCPRSSYASRGRFWSTFFHCSEVSPSTSSSSTASSAPPVSTPFPASPL